MFLDARKVPNEKVIDTTICIVGAGAAGITLALEFANSGYKVALIEGGDIKPDSDTQALYSGENIGISYTPTHMSRARFFGGTTNYWSGVNRTLDESDFEQRSWVPYSGWPFKKAELIPYYDRAAPVFQTPNPDEKPATEWADQIGVNYYPWAGGALSHHVSLSKSLKFGRAYEDTFRSSKNIWTYLNGNITELIRTENGSAISSVIVKTITGTTFSVTAKIFVLACGGIENARVLLNSGGEGRDAIGNAHDLVGRFFMEHPKIPCGYIIAKGVNPDNDYYEREMLDKRVKIKGHLGITYKLQKDRQLVNFLGNLWHVSSQGEKSLVQIGRGLSKGEIPDNTADHLIHVLKDFDVVYERFYSVMAGYGYTKYSLHSVSEQSPNPDSRVMLSEERDRIDMRKIKLDWRLSELDKLSLRKGMHAIGEELGRLGLGRTKVDITLDDQYWNENLYWSYHHMGTTRMHNDPTQGVVNADCRVHGIDNLFIAGSSVFPSVGCATPTLTIGALAIRLADHIKQNLEKKG